MSPGPALDLLFKSHPWHVVSIGAQAPQRVTVFVEITPSDPVKYELDKDSGRFSPVPGTPGGRS